jgi:hypothetical protein
MKRITRVTTLAVASVLLSFGTAVGAGSADAPAVREVRVGLGTACSSNGLIGPTSYPATDIGKPGVPKISSANLSMLNAIRRYVHPKTLMFAYVPTIREIRTHRCGKTTPTHPRLGCD